MKKRFLVEKLRELESRLKAIEKGRPVDVDTSSSQKENRSALQLLSEAKENSNLNNLMSNLTGSNDNRVGGRDNADMAKETLKSRRKMNSIKINMDVVSANGVETKTPG